MGSESIEAVRVSKSKSSGKSFPPGFRFHPTDEELVLYYLKRKICRRSLKLDIIGEVDVYKWDPEELPGQSKLKTGDRQWFFFCPRDRRYPNGGRLSRATMHGYWKATGKDRIIKCKSCSAGIKKTLVYYVGRAPSGQRTDWVMHEYTMDEEALKRCQSAQEHYALCKVFKKSGPGPKNGEQYGAPFLEEEWSDDDCLDVNALLVHNVNDENQLYPITVEEEPLFSDDVVQLLNKIMDETENLPPRAQAERAFGEEENDNSLLEYSLSNVDFHDQRIVLGSSYEQYDVQPGSDLAKSSYGVSEATSLTNVSPQPLVVNEDFLEINDLIGPQPAIRNSERSIAEDLHFVDFDGLSDFDLYNDSTRFHEMATFETQPFQQPYDMNNLEYGTETSGFHTHSNDTVSEVVNHHELHHEHQMSYDLWNFDQRNRTFVPAQATHVAISHPSSGVVIDENPDSHVNQCPNTKEDNGTYSWLSSTLWAFVDSIPTTPASASESTALVNKAFERMSSFSRGRNVNAAAAAAAGVNSTLATRRSSSSSRGIIYFSVLGVFFAILWVFLGTSIELLGRCISS